MLFPKYWAYILIMQKDEEKGESTNKLIELDDNETHRTRSSASARDVTGNKVGLWLISMALVFGNSEQTNSITFKRLYIFSKYGSFEAGKSWRNISDVIWL